MVKVSVIVPIYNAEKYLYKCIDSIINQTYKNLEIMLINDGSTDKSEEIVSSFNDSRIKYIKKKNTGVGNTRNVGIKKSTGDYVMFVDSDDYIELNCVEKMMTKVEQEKCDLVISNYFIDLNGLIKIDFPMFNSSSLKDNPSIIYHVNYGPCNKLYHRSLVEDGNMFIENLKYEDTPFVCEAICRAKKVGIIPDYLSHYVMHKNSETTTRDERIFDIFKITDIIIENVKKYTYINNTNVICKIILTNLKNARFIDDRNLKNRFIDYSYNYLNIIDKNWSKCNYIKEYNFIKRIIFSNKFLFKLFIHFI